MRRSALESLLSLWHSERRSSPGIRVESSRVDSGETDDHGDKPGNGGHLAAPPQLAGSVYLNGDEVGPLDVRLRHSGAVIGRIVDEEGLPRGGLALSELDSVDPELAPDRAKLPRGDSIPWLLVGDDGRFRVEGLILGLKYGAGATRGLVYLGEVFRDMTVAPVEVKDLGDLKIVPH